MAFTVRPSEEETQVIQKAMKKLGVKSMAKAVTLACGEMLSLQDKVNLLERQLRTANQRRVKAENAINDYQKSQHALVSFNPKDV